MRSTIVLSLLLLLGNVGCQNAPPVSEAQPLKRYEYKQIHLGTAVRLLIMASADSSANAAAEAAFVRVKAVDDAVDTGRGTTELRRLCDQAGGDPMPVSDVLFDLLEASQTLARETDGAYDPTDASLRRFWLGARDRMRLPSDTEVREALAAVGWEKLALDAEARTARLTEPGLCLELDDLAKGYAADLAMQALKERGHSQALVIVEPVYVAGDAPEGFDGWPVALTFGDPPGTPITVTNKAVRSVSDALRFDTFDGERYGWVVSPRTGRGLRYFTGATVVAPTGLAADALATVITRLPPDERAAFIEAHPEATFYVREDAD